MIVTAVITDSPSVGGIGYITVTVTGGVLPIALSWSDGTSSSTVSGPAGKYTVTVTDAVGVIVTKAFVISQPTVYNADTTPVETSLLGDQIFRSLRTGKVTTATADILSTTDPLVTFSTQQTGDATEHTVAGFKAVTDAAGNGGLTVLCYPADPAVDPVVEAMTLFGSTVSINGSLVITGSTTQVTVQDIVVVDKTITLASGLSSIDGAGMVLGASLATMLYDSTAAAMVHSSGLLATTELRVGSSWDASTSRLGPSFFSFTTNAGSFTADDTALTLTNCNLVDCAFGGAYTIATNGLEYVSNGKYFGWNGTQWNTLDSLGAASLTVNSTGSSLGSTGLSLATTAEAVYFGAGACRIRYSSIDNALLFEFYSSATQTYVEASRIAAV